MRRSLISRLFPRSSSTRRRKSTARSAVISPAFRPIVPIVNVQAGMDTHFVAVMPHMVEPLAGMGITVTDHTLYLIVTEDGGLRIIPVRGVNSEGEQNEWDRT